MALDTAISLTTLDDVISFIGTSQIDGLWVYCSQGDATAATVEVTDATMVLIITGGVAAGTDTLTFADADKNTIAELIVAINALTGWEAGRYCHSDEDSADLVITGALACLTSANTLTFKIYANYLLTELINRASDFINRYCQRILKSAAYTNEQYFGSGNNRLLLEQYPVTRISRIRVNRANSFLILNSSTDANFCTVEITATVIRLIVDGGTNADDSSITLTDHTSIDSLITAIHALAKGWVCTTLATDTASRDADELLIRPSMLVDATMSAYCETGDDSLTEYKMIAPTEARNYGMIERAGTFIKSTEYHISYTAGYTTVPYALEMACLELVKYKYDESKKGTGLKMEQIGKVYKYEKFGLADLEYGLTPGIKAELDLFRRREF